MEQKLPQNQIANQTPSVVPVDMNVTIFHDGCKQLGPGNWMCYPMDMCYPVDLKKAQLVDPPVGPFVNEENAS